MFNRIGERNPNRTFPCLMEVTRHLWQGQRRKGFDVYDGCIPIIATGLRNLSEHGPTGPVFLPFGRDRMEPLWEAVGNPRREAAEARARKETARAQKEYQAKVERATQEQAAKQAAEREARRPVCAGCGAKFTDEWWRTAQATDRGTPKDSHPHLCDGCQHKAAALASAVPTSSRQEEYQEPLPGWAERREFMCYPRRPRCTEWRAACTDERWQAVERTGWGSLLMEVRPTLCRYCDQPYVTDVQQVWADEPRHEGRGQAVPEQKAGGTWLSPLPRLKSGRRPRPGRSVLPGRGGYSQGRGSACHRALSQSGGYLSTSRSVMARAASWPIAAVKPAPTAGC